MFSQITLGQYLPGDTLAYRLDPRSKIIITALYVIALFSAQHLLEHGGLILWFLFSWVICPIPLNRLFRGMRAFWGLILFLSLFSLLSTPGNVIFSNAAVQITQQGVAAALGNGVRLLLFILGTAFLMYCTTPLQLTAGIGFLLRPLSRLGLPGHSIAMIMGLSLRFLPLFVEQAQTITQAQISRGANLEHRNLFVKAKAYIPILIPLFFSVWERAEELAIGMENRCYQGERNQSSWQYGTWHIQDYICLGFAFLITLLCIAYAP